MNEIYMITNYKLSVFLLQVYAALQTGDVVIQEPLSRVAARCGAFPIIDSWYAIIER